MILSKLAIRLTNLFHEPQPLPSKPKRQISSELMKKIQAIQVKTSYLVNSTIAGEYVSAFKGRGMEFSEVREYTPGDDIRLIDWNVTARAGHPFVKEFREERELTVMLMVDVSSSGEFGSLDRLKNEVSAEIASILAFSAIRNNDKIGLIVFSDIIEQYIPPKKGKAHIWNIIRTILNFTPEGRKTDLSLPLEYLLNIQKRKTVAFLISDFQADGYKKALKLAKQKHDIISIAITDPRENTLPNNIGWIHLEDAETRESIFVDTNDKEIIESFHRMKEEEKTNRDKFFRSAGLDIIEISTDQSLIDPINRFFMMREKKH